MCLPLRHLGYFALAALLLMLGCIDNPEHYESVLTDPGIADVGATDDVSATPEDVHQNDENIDTGENTDSNTTPTCPEPDVAMICAEREVECGNINFHDDCGPRILNCGGCADHDNGACVTGTCQEPSCDDNIKNQNETDVDCGGDCPGCAEGKQCLVDDDCAQGHGLCRDGICTTGRVHDDLFALYNFAQGEGDIVTDLSGIEPAMDLTPQFYSTNLGTLQWPEDCDCIDFRRGILLNEYPTKFFSHLDQDPLALSIEIWIDADSTAPRGPARILASTNATDRNPQNLIFGPEHAAMALHTRYGSASDTERIYFDDTIQTELTHYVLTVADGTSTLYINGQPAPSGPHPIQALPSTWDSDYVFTVGAPYNDFNEERTWRGKMHLLALYDQALSPEVIAEHFTAGHQATDDL